MNRVNSKVFDLMNKVSDKSDVNISRSYDFGDSEIHGTGAFASRDIPSKEMIGEAFYSKNKKLLRTELGTRVNHQFKNNSSLKKEGENYNLYSTREINEGSEITANYKNTPSFIDKDVRGFKELK